MIFQRKIWLRGHAACDAAGPFRSRSARRYVCNAGASRPPLPRLSFLSNPELQNVRHQVGRGEPQHLMADAAEPAEEAWCTFTANADA